MVRGRRLETRDSSLESSQRASLVSIRSSISSNSPSDLEINEEEDEEPAIANLRISGVAEIYQCFFASSSVLLFLCFSLVPPVLADKRTMADANGVVLYPISNKKTKDSLRHIGPYVSHYSPARPTQESLACA